MGWVMMRKRAQIFAGVLGLWLCGQSPAWAKDEFLSHYEKASESYKAGHYADAIAEYEQAYRLRQLPRLRLMMGKAHLKLGHSEEALQHFDWFLHTNPSEQDREETRRLSESAQLMLSPVRVPAKMPEEAAPAAAPPSEGKAAIAAPSTSEASARRAEGATAAGADVTAVRPPPPPPPVSPPPTPRVMTGPIWGSLAMGGAFLIVAAVTGGMYGAGVAGLQGAQYGEGSRDQVLMERDRLGQIGITAGVFGGLSAAVLTGTLVACGVRYHQLRGQPLRPVAMKGAARLWEPWLRF